ncbi:MAG: DNA polymerase III subunit beta, partial [Planctomycetes bacterium]|nr:DNA polymerase III subunit beta [Planctomycetota bacterium]
MKIHCHRLSLAAAFQVVSGVVPSRTPKDILKNVMLQVADGKAVLIGTDQEVGIRYEIPGVEIESPGEMLLPTSRMISILRELQDDGINLEVDDSSVLVRAGHSEFRLSLEDPTEYPPVSAFDEQEYYVISGPVLREAIQRTAFATDIESTRYALGGVLLELSPESVTLAATDSRRLALVKLSCRFEGEESSGNISPVVPSKAMTLIEKSIPENEEQDVWISVHTNSVVVKSGLATISSRLVEGRFPRYRDVIPSESKFSLDLPV